jgi:sporulation protein YqfC
VYFFAPSAHKIVAGGEKMAAKAKRRKKNWRLRAGAAMEFPPQVVANGLGIHVYDNTACTVEGFLNIAAYSEKVLKLTTEFGDICFLGRDFYVCSMQEGVLSFTGMIEQIRYGDTEEIKGEP